MSSSTPKVRISLACVACKKRKAKCSGGPPPCQSCKASGTPCIIDESLDGRRKAAAKRTYDELTYHKTFIEGLLTYIRTFDKSSLDNLVDLIKADVPLPEIGALIDESLRLSQQGAQAEESLRVLQLDSSASRNIRRRVEKERGESTSQTPSTSDASQKFESQAQHLDQSERLVAFLKNTQCDEIEGAASSLGSLQNSSLYDSFLQYMARAERRSASLSASKRSMSFVNSGGPEFSRARTLSLPNLFEYQQYLQGLFSNYAPMDLQAEAITGSQGRKEWHPALKLRFSSSSVESDENSEGQAESDASIAGDLPSSSEDARESNAKGKSRAQDLRFPERRHRNPDRLRLRIDNDPRTGEDFQLSPSISGTLSADHSSQATAARVELIDSAMDQRMSNLNIPLYQLLPLTGIDDSPLARSYTSYRDEARSMIANGVPIQNVFGSARIEVNLIFRPRNPSDAHSVCNWASELCAAFRRDFDMYWTLACAMLLSRFMRWLLVPTEESYNQIPTTIRPTQTQRFIPHNPTADLIALPGIRDALCIRFRDCVTPMINNCRFTWPHSLDEAVEHDVETDTYYLTPKYEEYVSNPDNFLISRRLLDTFPELKGRPDVKFMD